MRANGLALVCGALLLWGCASQLNSAVSQNDIQTVTALLDQGMNINDQSTLTGFAPLQVAAMRGNLDMVRLLLDRGAQIDIRLPDSGNENGNDNTPLLLAIRAGHYDVVRLLLERGASISIQGCYEKDFVGVCHYQGAAVKFAERNGDAALLALVKQAEAKLLAKSSIVPGAAEAGRDRPSEDGTKQSPVPSSDVDQVGARAVTASKNRHAIVIGVERYRQKLPKADFATHDAKIMGEYLVKVMGYPEENVVVLLDDRALRTDLEKYIEKWLPNRVEQGDSVFVYFSGHGTPNTKTGDAYLVPYDGDPAYIETTGYPLKRLYDNLAKLPTKESVVLLDSCFSGEGGRSVLAKGMRPMVLSIENPVLRGGKTVVLSAGSGEQVSGTYDAKGHGLLTYFVLKGLQGEADGNKDGAIDLSELFDYVKPRVARVARREYNNEQTPQLLGNPELMSRGIRLTESPKP